MPALLLQNLGVICGTCDFLNAPQVQKCSSCGANVNEAPPPRPKPVAVADAPTSPSGSQAVPPGLKSKSAVVPTIAPLTTPPSLGDAPVEPSGVMKMPAQPQAPAPVAPAPDAAPTPPPAATPPPEEPLLEATVDAEPTPRPPPAALQPPPPAPRPAPEPPRPAPEPPGPRFGLAVLAGPSRGQRFKLAAAGAQVGRSRGVILFPDDPFVSPMHATFLVREGKLVLRDEGSTSGCYVSIAGQETIPPASMFCTGIRLFRYVGAIAMPPPAVQGRVLVYGAPVPPTQEHYAVEEILLGGRPGRTVITAGPILTIGQGKCDLSFPNDDGMAPRHCELSPMPGGAMIRDLSGGLGTFVRVSGERVLKAGDRVRIGQQTLQVEVLA
jgi:pSer/pThr/pTyr-binding forkhead associated (FHA) protein